MPWTCPTCNGKSDLGFNICWTCQAPRPETVTAPDSVPVSSKKKRRWQFGLRTLILFSALSALAFAFGVRWWTAPERWWTTYPDGNISSVTTKRRNIWFAYETESVESFLHDGTRVHESRNGVHRYFDATGTPISRDECKQLMAEEMRRVVDATHRIRGQTSGG